MKFQWQYKDANRCYWNILAETTGYIDHHSWDEYNDVGNHEWTCEIHYSQNDADCLTCLVWEDLLFGQYDEPIKIEYILREWMASNTSVAMGISKYSRPTVVKDEENDYQ